MSSPATAAQTVGPFFELGMSWAYSEDLVAPNTEGPIVVIRGCVFDGDQAPIPDAVLEFWQADAAGRFPQPSAADLFRGFGRIATNARGEFRVRTIKPGSVDGQAPHVCVQVFMRGLLKAAHTRLYFADDPKNAVDPVLAVVPAARRNTLMARPEADGTFRWNVHMQGEEETVFFEF